MAKQFHIPEIYESSLIRIIKQARQAVDPRKKDLRAVTLDFGPVQFLIPRHFGFCYGVQNAIDIAYTTIDSAQGKSVFFLSEMIHNPDVNDDLRRRGVEFLFETDGSIRIPIESLSPDDIVVIPAFGTTLDIEKKLMDRGINANTYDTTCPFVEKVWKKGAQLGKKDYNLVIHGKANHEETRATYSHATADAKAVVIVLNTDEARFLAECMLGERTKAEFDSVFGAKSTPGFDPVRDLQRFGVINQTTMLATETQEVIDILRDAAVSKYGAADIENHVADTSDTLCYATNENQSATLALLNESIDLAIVVGGFNSSNTMHIVEILESNFPTYHIRNSDDIPDPSNIRHFNQWNHTIEETTIWLDLKKRPLRIAVTSGASCPDALVDAVILKIASWIEGSTDSESAIAPFQAMLTSAVNG